MTAVEDLLRRLRRAGVELQSDGTRLRWRPEAGVGPELRKEILASRAALILLLAVPTVPTVPAERAFHPPAGEQTYSEPPSPPGCPQCQGPLDDRRRCWGCCERRCSGCGRPTGSAFIAFCWPCGLREGGTP